MRSATASRQNTIVLMGLDGSGKSTQAELLWQRASARGEPWVSLHHSSTKVPGVAGLKRRFHREAIHALKRRRAHVEAGDEGQAPAGGGTALSWMISAFIVFGSFSKAVWYRWRYRASGRIMDRCLLDDIIKVHWRFGCRLPAAGVVLRLAPRPDVVIVLEGDPAITFGRKKAANCSFQEYLRKSDLLETWLQEAARSGWRIRRVGIDGRGVADVHQAVLHALDRSDEGVTDRASDLDRPGRLPRRIF
jgi:thymidylate kinase